MTDVHRQETTHTHKDKPSKLPEQTRKHDIAINMPKDDRWSIKQKGCKDSTRVHGMSWSICNHQGGKTKEGSEIWMQAKILEGVAAATTECE